MRFYDDPSGNTRYDSSPPIYYDGFQPAIESEWKYADSATKSSGTLKGHVPGKIWVRVCAKGADEPAGAWSDPAEDLVR
jgi:hypothetical protein